MVSWWGALPGVCVIVTVASHPSRGTAFRILASKRLASRCCKSCLCSDGSLGMLQRRTYLSWPPPVRSRANLLSLPLPALCPVTCARYRSHKGQPNHFLGGWKPSRGMVPPTRGGARPTLQTPRRPHGGVSSGRRRQATRCWSTTGPKAKKCF